MSKVTDNGDYKEPTNILKLWHFPPWAVRVSYTNGPRSALHTPGVGIAVDANRIKGLRTLNLPGRFLGEWRYWDQGGDIDSADPESCVLYCKQRRHWGLAVQYEQLLTNIFGFYGSARYFHPRKARAEPEACSYMQRGCAESGSQWWLAVGPMAEFTIPRLSVGPFGVRNFSVQVGLVLRTTSAPRFEFRVNMAVFRWGREHQSFGVPK